MKVTAKTVEEFMSEHNPGAYLRPVLVINSAGTRLVFESMRAASKLLGISQSYLTMAAKGKRTHAKGYKVRYATHEETK